MSSDNKIKNKYFYSINYPTYEEELCKMEMRFLFNAEINGKYFISDKYIIPSRSPYIKQSICIMLSASTLDELTEKIKSKNITFNDFKVIYIKIDGGDVSYDEWLKSARLVADAVDGEAEMHEPKILLGLTKFNGRWIFGLYEKNNMEWHTHDNKPHTYSHSLSIRDARAIVNIAVGNNLDAKIIDPCCGVGTVVIEGLSMGLNIRGSDINRFTVRNAKENLLYFEMPDVIRSQDMHTITEHYDVAIVDIPYGIFVPVTLEQQTEIIKSSHRIADKQVIITFENMNDVFEAVGLEIIDQCQVTKGKFVRYVTVCKK
ncbi:MAG: methylase domain protein [Bacillales bacterium]|nr:methylase domain protein [Bacillales bacterium]